MSSPRAQHLSLYSQPRMKSFVATGRQMSFKNARGGSTVDLATGEWSVTSPLQHLAGAAPLASASPSSAAGEASTMSRRRRIIGIESSRSSNKAAAMMGITPEQLRLAVEKVELEHSSAGKQ